MPTPTTRDDSSLFQFRVKVPADVREKAKGTMIFVHLPGMGSDAAVTVASRIGVHVKFSLRTRNPSTAKARNDAAASHVAKLWGAMRDGPTALSLREIVALSGDVYRLFLDECGDEPGDVDNWIALKGFNRAVREGRIAVPPALQPNPSQSNEAAVAREVFGIDLTSGINEHVTGTPAMDALEARFGLLANWTLMRNAVEIGPDDRIRLLHAIEKATTDVALVLKRHARMRHPSPGRRGRRADDPGRRDRAHSLRGVLLPTAQAASAVLDLERWRGG